jgi:hypothetical protein
VIATVMKTLHLPHPVSRAALARAAVTFGIVLYALGLMS